MGNAHIKLDQSNRTGAAFDEWLQQIHTAETDASEPTNLLIADETLAPPTWSDLVGQRRVTDELQVRIHSALNRGAAMCHVCLDGGPGTGKTTIARLIALELDRPLTVLEKPPTSAAALIDALWNREDGVLFCDEVQLWPAARQADLLQLTESGTLQGAYGSVRFPNLTVVVATTDPQKISAPLMSRFMCRPRWEDYTDDEMGEIAAGMAKRAGVEMSTKTAKTLGRAGAGVPRTVRKLVIAARDLAEVGRDASGPAVLHFCATEPDGMTLDHIGLLEALASQPEGSAGLDTLTQLMEMPSGQVRDIERLLLKRRYLSKSGQGRRITPAGRTRAAASR